MEGRERETEGGRNGEKEEGGDPFHYERTLTFLLLTDQTWWTKGQNLSHGVAKSLLKPPAFHFL